MSLLVSLNVYQIGKAYYLGLPLNKEFYHQICSDGEIKKQSLSIVHQILPLRSFAFKHSLDYVIFRDLLQNDYDNYCQKYKLNSENIFNGMALAYMSNEPIIISDLKDIFDGADFQPVEPDLITEILDNLALRQIFFYVNNGHYFVEIKHDEEQTFLIESDGSIVASSQWDTIKVLVQVDEFFPIVEMFSHDRHDHSNLYKLMATIIKTISYTRHRYSNENFALIYLSLLRRSRHFLKKQN